MLKTSRVRPLLTRKRAKALRRGDVDVEALATQTLLRAPKLCKDTCARLGQPNPLCRWCEDVEALADQAERLITQTLLRAPKLCKDTCARLGQPNPLCRWCDAMWAHYCMIEAENEGA